VKLLVLPLALPMDRTPAEAALTRRNILSLGGRACVLPVGSMVCWELRISECCRSPQGSSRVH
jgi:hypothetical protein